MNLRSLHFFQLIIRTGSFTAAARAADVSQSAVTQAMNVLERSLGTPLFVREGRKKRPTRSALRLAECIGDFEAGMRLLSSEPSLGEEEILRIGISPAAALIYGPVIVNAWRQTRQHGRVVMNNANALDLLRGLRRGELDLVVAPRPRAESLADFRLRILFSSKPTIYARIGHPMREASSLSEIRDVGWVVVGTSDGPGGMIEEAFRVRGLGEATIVAQCDDYSACLQLIGDSNWMAVIPNSRLVDDYQRTRIRQLQIKEGMPRYDVCLFNRPARGEPSPDKATKSVVEAILAVTPAI